MTLNEMQRIKQWHVTHRAGHPLEYHLWDGVLTLWVMGWSSLIPALAFGLVWLMPLCLLGMLLTGIYVAWRMRAQRAHLTWTTWGTQSHRSVGWLQVWNNGQSHFMTDQPQPYQPPSYEPAQNYPQIYTSFASAPAQANGAILSCEAQDAQAIHPLARRLLGGRQTSSDGQMTDWLPPGVDES